MKRPAAIAAVLVLLAIAGCSPRGTSEGVEGSGSCLPGTDTCIESCVKGEPAHCPNPGGTPRTCDCDHPWNQGRTEVV
jgi:hypothetical protein